MNRFVCLILLSLLFSTIYAEDIRIGINREDLYLYNNSPKSGNSWFISELRAWGKKNGYKPVFVIKEWGELEDDFEEGRLEVIYPVNYLKSRERMMDFTHVIRREPFTLFSQKKTRVVSLGDIRDQRIGTLDSSLLSSTLDPFFQEVVYYPSVDRAVESLKRGEVQYLVLNKGAADTYNEFIFSAGDLWFDNEGGIGVQKGRDDILNSLNSHFFSGSVLRSAVQSRIKEEEIAVLQHILDRNLRVKTPQTLDVVIHKDAFPFVEIRDGEIKSSLIEVVEHFNTISKYIQLNIVSPEDQLKFNHEIERLKTGEIDILAPAGITEDRNRSFKRIYEDTIIQEDFLILLSHKLSRDVNHIFEIKGTLGTIDSHLLEEVARSNLPEEMIRVYSSREDALSDLNSGRIQYLLDTEKIIEGFVKLENYGNVKRVMELKKFSYGAYTSPEVSDDILHDMKVIFNTMSSKWVFQKPSSSSIAPIFVSRYLFQIKVLVILILAGALFFQKRHLEEKRQSERILKALIGSLENVNHVNSEETGEHIVRVGLYAEVISRALSMPKKITEEIKTFASLHDVGKVAIPREILSKPGKLSAEEFKVMKEHTIKGRDIIENLSGIPSKADLATNIVLHHHEKWDGTGYPYGLKGGDIPLEARIVALSDVYDALRMPRVYKKGLSHRESLDIILKESGRHFDPDLVEIFKRKHNEFDAIYEKQLIKKGA